MFQPSTLIHLRKTTIDDLDFIGELESDPQNAKFIIPWSAEKQGFTKEGTLRECLLTEGTFESFHIMAILKREFFQNKK